MPSPVQTITTFIASLSALGTFIGVSLLIPGRAGFLFGGRPLRTSPAGPVVELTGIGGGVESNDPSLTAAAQREAAEEINCVVRLLPSPNTLLVRGPGRVASIRLTGSENPLAIVFRGYRTPAHEPWHPEHQGDTCLVVFLAELLSCPRPSSEIPLLTWLDPETLCATARADLPFSKLPGELTLLAPAFCPPADALVRLTESQEALILALEDSALPFYQSIADHFS